MLDWKKVRKVVIPEGVVRKISCGGIVLWGRFVSLCAAVACGAVSSAAALKSVMAKNAASAWREFQRAEVWLHEQRPPTERIRFPAKVWMSAHLISNRWHVRIKEMGGSATTAVSAAVKQFRSKVLGKIRFVSKLRLSASYNFRNAVCQKILFMQTVRMKLSGAAHQTLGKIAQCAKPKLLAGIGFFSAVKTGLEFSNRVTLFWKTQELRAMKRMTRLSILSRLKETASAHSTKIPAALRAKIKMLGGHGWFAAFEHRMKLMSKVTVLGKILAPGTIKQLSNLRLLSGLKKAASVCKMKLPAALRPKIKMLGGHGWFTHWENFSRLTLKMTMNGSGERFAALRERMRSSDRMTLRGAASKLKAAASSALSSHFHAAFGFSALASGISLALQRAKLWLRCAAPMAMAARLSEAFQRSARLTSAIVGKTASGEVLRHERNAVRLGSVSGTLSACVRRAWITLRNPKIVFSAIDKTAVWIQRAAAKCSLFGNAEPTVCAPILASGGALAVMAISSTTWEAPVQTGRSLLITQIHSVEQTGNKIKLT